MHLIHMYYNINKRVLKENELYSKLYLLHRVHIEDALLKINARYGKQYGYYHINNISSSLIIKDRDNPQLIFD